MTDPVLFNDWHPVAARETVVQGRLAPATLLGRDIALWRGADGEIHAWEDRCPHRGTRLTMGSVDGDSVTSRYHGWRYDARGRCIHVPAQPGLRPSEARATAYGAAERYGMIWVCLGTPGGRVLPFPEYDDPNLRKVLCGPYQVSSSGPRIVENFLDMAHFGFVHSGVLGDPSRAEVEDYSVGDFHDGEGGTGIQATRCFAWQPQTNRLAHGGSMVEYEYRVVRPLTAILTKLPQAQQGFREAISLHVQPVAEEASVVWMVLAMTNFQSSDEELRAFQDAIFLQDRPILENQVPRRLPLAQRAELSVRCDRMSLAYRRYLRAQGMTFGVVP